MLKVRLRDYAGAHTDLKQLVELYPETELSDQACLHLADATMKAGLYEEAAGLYRKVYNLGLSVAAQTESAWGAGRCLYETGRYEEAAEWLNRYTTLARDRSRPTFSAACLLLGQAYLALHQPSQAQAALRLALRGELSHQQHVQTVTVLVKTYLEQGLFLEALGVLENAGGWQLSQQEAVELALLRAQALRSIGLAEKAIGLLQEKSQYLPNPELQAKVALEVARCQIAGDNLEPARKTLGPVFEAVEPGPLAGQIGRELALVCLRLGQTAQAVSVCSLLLERAAASERPAILALLADAYRRQGKLDQAMATTLNQYEVATDPNAAPSLRNNRL
jgi:tetratricopeptide (TPR) repeat protein